LDRVGVPSALQRLLSLTRPRLGQSDFCSGLFSGKRQGSDVPRGWPERQRRIGYRAGLKLLDGQNADRGFKLAAYPGALVPQNWGRSSRSSVRTATRLWSSPNGST
jgi:hypothetical protein